MINGFEPKKLFEHFEEISAVPRPSGHEEKIADFLVDFAKKHGLFCRQDAFHNVIIKKSGSKGCENLPPVLLQGHGDMVCEKRAGVTHDFEKDGLFLVQTGEFLQADGTTLGADDGVAAAVILTILEDETLVHPPLECVITSGEETGFTGASHLDFSLLSARTLLNLDVEEEGIATVSCAGGARMELFFPILLWEQTKKPALCISVFGLKGGHSGTDIHKGRGNAIKLTAELLDTLAAEKTPFQLSSFTGGGRDNAIPRECGATLAFSSEKMRNKAKERLQEKAAEMIGVWQTAEPNFQIKITPSDAEREMSNADTDRLLKLLCLAPNGVRARNYEAGDFITASLNLGIVQTETSGVSVTFLLRSSDRRLQEQTKRELQLLADIFGCSTKITSEYPGWEYKDASPVREICKECWRELTQKELKTESIHAGLECGLFCEKLPGLDAIAVGPQIDDCHTPTETLHLKSMEQFYQFVKKVLGRLAGK